MDLILAIVALCSTHAGASNATGVNEIQSKCQAYYANCYQKETRSMLEYKILLNCIKDRKNGQ